MSRTHRPARTLDGMQANPQADWTIADVEWRCRDVIWIMTPPATGYTECAVNAGVKMLVKHPLWFSAQSAQKFTRGKCWLFVDLIRGGYRAQNRHGDDFSPSAAGMNWRSHPPIDF
jgi:hypothetical protein